VISHPPTSTPQTSAKQVFNEEIGRQHPLKLLLVEDNPVNQKLVISILDRLGYHAKFANNGVEALKLLTTQSFDVILMDIQMPEMDGETATQYIRRDLPAERQPRIIAMTANGLPGDREHYLAIGMDGYLGKPIKIVELVKTLQESHSLGASISQPPTNEITTTQPALSPPASCSLDVSYLREFCEVMGEGGIEMTKELARLFRQNTRDLLLELQRASSERNFFLLMRTAHTLKGNSGQLGAIHLAELCLDLELQGKTGNQDSIQALIEEMKGEFSKVENELEKVLQLSELAWYANNHLSK
jgi:CheY-like chemotaxis protein